MPIPELAGRGSHFPPIPHSGTGKREDRGNEVAREPESKLLRKTCENLYGSLPFIQAYS